MGTTEPQVRVSADLATPWSCAIQLFQNAQDSRPVLARLATIAWTSFCEPHSMRFAPDSSSTHTVFRVWPPSLWLRRCCTVYLCCIPHRRQSPTETGLESYLVDSTMTPYSRSYMPALFARAEYPLRSDFYTRKSATTRLSWAGYPLAFQSRVTPRLLLWYGTKATDPQ